MLIQELVKISRRFFSRVKFTSQDLDHFSHTSESGYNPGFIVRLQSRQRKRYFGLELPKFNVA